jgi:hypothetical protein
MARGSQPDLFVTESQSDLFGAEAPPAYRPNPDKGRAADHALAARGRSRPIALRVRDGNGAAGDGLIRLARSMRPRRKDVWVKITKYFEAIRSRPDRAIGTNGFCASSRRRSGRSSKLMVEFAAGRESTRWKAGTSGLSCCRTGRPSIMDSSTEDTNHESSVLRGYRHSVHRVSRPRYCPVQGSRLCAITFEHASGRTDVHRLTVEGIAA